ncbi:MAG: adenosylcobinamide-GDP ribazoletransferase [Aestuariivirgaceae bacterium]
MTDDDGQMEAQPGDVWQPRYWLGSLRDCLMFLTGLPVPQRPDDEVQPLARFVHGFPLAGAIIGLLSGLVLVAGAGIGLNTALAATCAVLASVLITGGLHEDGLADVADGFGGGNTPERKLEIMRDSRTGPYGVLALIFAVLLKVLALTALLSASGGTWPAAMVLIGAAALSRSFMALLMHSLPPARSSGRSAEAGRPSRQGAHYALGMGLAVSLPVLWYSCGWWPALTAILAGFAVYYIIRRISSEQIEGQTGDVLGATQLITEIAMLIAVSASLG